MFFENISYTLQKKSMSLTSILSFASLSRICSSVKFDCKDLISATTAYLNKVSHYTDQIFQKKRCTESTSLGLTDCSLLFLELLLKLCIIFLHLIKLFIVRNVELVLASKVYLLLTILLERNPAIISQIIQSLLNRRLLEVELLQRIGHILRI